MACQRRRNDLHAAAAGAAGRRVLVTHPQPEKSRRRDTQTRGRQFSQPSYGAATRTACGRETLGMAAGWERAAIGAAAGNRMSLSLRDQCAVLSVGMIQWAQGSEWTDCCVA